MMVFKNLKHIEGQMKDIQKKLRVYKKKRERFGLTDEETQENRKILKEFYLLQDEMIDSRMEEVFFPMIYNTKTKNAIETIKKYVPWNGGAVIRNKDVDDIMEAIDKLNSQKRIMVYEALLELHDNTINKFADFANNAEKKDIDWLNQVSVFITGNQMGNVFDIISYIDSRYRDFCDLLGYELPEVEIDVAEEEGF